jgi:hypothetical protein
LTTRKLIRANIERLRRHASVCANAVMFVATMTSTVVLCADSVSVENSMKSVASARILEI